MDCGIATTETYEVINKIWMWSLEVLAGGRWPTSDHCNEKFSSGYRYQRAGERFPGGLRGVLGQILGDWKWQKETMGSLGSCRLNSIH